MGYLTLKILKGTRQMRLRMRSFDGTTQLPPQGEEVVLASHSPAIQTDELLSTTQGMANFMGLAMVVASHYQG